MALNIIKNYLTNNRCYQSGITCPKIGIQIHTIGTGQGTAQSVADYWNQASVSACVHYCVDADTAGKVLQLLPETIRSWADAGYGNSNLITMEICESDFIKYTSGASYTVTDEAKFKADILRGYQTAVELCAKICKERGWDPTAKLPSGLYLISSHDEGRLAGLSSAHVDPTHVWTPLGLTMDGFRAAVKAAMNPKFKVGTKYVLLSNLAMRGTPAGAALLWDQVTPTTRKNSVKTSDGLCKLKKGTVVTCRDVQEKSGSTWIKMSSGWIAGTYVGTEEVKEYTV